jgi:hypothetical protein
MLKLSIKCSRFETNYPTCTQVRSSENICSSSGGGAQGKKEKQDETQFTTEIGGKTNLGPSYFFAS